MLTASIRTATLTLALVMQTKNTGGSKQLAKTRLTDPWERAPPAGQPLSCLILEVVAINICKGWNDAVCKKPEPIPILFHHARQDTSTRLLTSAVWCNQFAAQMPWSIPIDRTWTQAFHSENDTNTLDKIDKTTLALSIFGKNHCKTSYD